MKKQKTKCYEVKIYLKSKKEPLVFVFESKDYMQTFFILINSDKDFINMANHVIIQRKEIAYVTTDEKYVNQ